MPQTICSTLVEACFSNRSRQQCNSAPTILYDSRASSLDSSRASQKTAEASIEFSNRSQQQCSWELPTIPDDSRANLDDRLASLDDSLASLDDNSASQKTAETSIEFSTAMVAGPWVFPESSERSIPWKIEACFSNRSRQKFSWRPTIWYCSSLYASRASQKTAEASIEFSTAMVAGPWAAVSASPYRGDGCGRRAFWILNLVAHTA
jgi:hypothetical protein